MQTFSFLEKSTFTKQGRWWHNDGWMDGWIFSCWLWNSHVVPLLLLLSLQSLSGLSRPILHLASDRELCQHGARLQVRVTSSSSLTLAFFLSLSFLSAVINLTANKALTALLVFLPQRAKGRISEGCKSMMPFTSAAKVEGWMGKHNGNKC